MIHEAAHNGVRAAAERFGIRQAGALSTLLNVLGAGVGGAVAKGALNAAAPKLMAGLENAGAAPINMVRNAVRPTPASTFAKHLNAAQPAPLPMKPRIV